MGIILNDAPRDGTVQYEYNGPSPFGSVGLQAYKTTMSNRSWYKGGGHVLSNRTRCWVPYLGEFNGRGDCVMSDASHSGRLVGS
jgi:hypothetical protein